MLEENNGPMCGDDHEDLRLIDTDNQLEQQILDIGSLPFSTTQNKILLGGDCNGNFVVTSTCPPPANSQ